MEDEKIFEKREHQLIYRAFLDTLGDPGKQMQKIQKKLQEELSEEQKQELQSKLQSLGKLLNQVKNKDEEKVFTFVLKNYGEIFKNVNPQVKSLSEENFSQFLLSVFKEIRKKLAEKENLEDNEIKGVVNKCVGDIRGTEAWNCVVGSVKQAMPEKGLLKKIPGIGKVFDAEEEEEPPLSDEEMVTTFLRRLLPPVFLYAITVLILSLLGFSASPIALGITVVFALSLAVKGLFSNNRKGTLYNPDTKKEKDWDNEIVNGINKILVPAEEAGKGEQPVVTTEGQLTQAKEPPTVLGGVTTNQQNSSMEKGLQK